MTNIESATTGSDNKNTVRAYVEAFNEGDFDAVAKLCTGDVIIQGVLGKGGLDTVVPVWQELYRAFNVQLEVEDMVAEDEVVVVRYTERGTFRGDFRGTPATGREYTIVAMEWFQFRDGKIAARWGARDSASIMRQVQGS